ncbi:MAG: DUF695 domain-containing protein [Planctomycetes bacterium]|nr:DUF695 domain-containing protein [Planctomycetota bacterium]
MSWSHRTTQIESRPAGVLIDDRFRGSLPVRELPRLAWFGVYCRHDPGGGFWHPDETPALDAIEQDLIRLCEQFGRGWAVYVMRIDTRGIREYYLYCGGSAALAQALPSLRAAHPDYRIEFEETADPEWSRYRTFLPDHEPVA